MQTEKGEIQIMFPQLDDTPTVFDELTKVNLENAKLKKELGMLEKIDEKKDAERFNETMKILDEKLKEVKCEKCEKQGQVLCDECFENSMKLPETEAVLKSRENILKVIEYLMKENIRFYLDNNLITKHAVFTFHRPHLDRVEFHFPTLIEVKIHKDSRNFDVGFIRLSLEHSEKIDKANYRGTMRYGKAKW